MRKISACIVSYNGADEVIAAVESLQSHTRDWQLQVYLVDNASPDGTGKTLAAHSFAPGVEVIQLPQNLGFGSGHNQVLPKLDSEYHFVLNPDILVDSNVLVDICRWMDEHPEVVMATPRLLFPDGREQILPKRRPNILGLAARQGIPGLEAFGRRYAMLDEDLTKPTPIQFCTGSFFVFAPKPTEKSAGLTRAILCMWRTQTLPRRHCKPDRCTICLSSPPTMPGTVRPAAVSNPFYSSSKAWHAISTSGAGNWAVEPYFVYSGVAPLCVKLHTN